MRRGAAQASPGCGTPRVATSPAYTASAVRMLPRSGKSPSTALILASCSCSPCSTTLANSSVSASCRPCPRAVSSQSSPTRRELTSARSAPRNSAEEFIIPFARRSVKKLMAVVAATAITSAATRMRCSPARQSRTSRRSARCQRDVFTASELPGFAPRRAGWRGHNGRQSCHRALPGQA